MAQYIKKADTVNVSAASSLSAGQPVKIFDNFWGVTHCPVSQGVVCALDTTGIYSFEAGGSISVGDTVYFASNAVTATSASGAAIGKALEAASSGGAVQVILNK